MVSKAKKETEVSRLGHEVKNMKNSVKIHDMDIAELQNAIGVLESHINQLKMQLTLTNKSVKDILNILDPDDPIVFPGSK